MTRYASFHKSVNEHQWSSMSLPQKPLPILRPFASNMAFFLGHPRQEKGSSKLDDTQRGCCCGAGILKVCEKWGIKQNSNVKISHSFNPSCRTTQSQKRPHGVSAAYKKHQGVCFNAQMLVEWKRLQNRSSPVHG